jgi:hypothetical protein
MELTEEGLKLDEKGLEQSIQTYHRYIADKVKISLQLKDIFLMLSFFSITIILILTRCAVNNNN